MNEHNELLNSSEVDRLVILVEEATRATKDTPRRFIEPARGTLDRAKARRHHIVFGRRGSGKTSLLRKAGADLTLKRVPIAFIDLEAFKGHAYPDVLLSVLIDTLNTFDAWLATAGTHASSMTSFWNRFWGASPERPPLEKRKLALVRDALKAETKVLNDLLHSEDDAELVEQVGESLRMSARALSALSGKSSAEAATPIAKSRVELEAKTETEHSAGRELIPAFTDADR